MADTDAYEGACIFCLEVMLWAWGHGLTNKAQALLGQTTAIRTNLRHVPDELHNIMERLNKIDQIVQEITELPSPFKMERVPLNGLITTRIGNLSQRVPYDAIAFQISVDPKEPPVRANPRWLYRMLDILIDNAVEAMSNSAKKEINIETVVIDQGVRLTITDTGTGINKHVLQNLFQKPQTLRSENRGRGLYIVQLITDIYGGNIKVYDTNPSGTTIVIWLPLNE